MKINEIQKIGPMNPYQRHVQQQHQIMASKKEKPKDEVRISEQAKELQNATASSASPETNEARNEKLQQLKKAVSTGTYHVEAGKIAEKLFPYIK